MPGEQLPGLVSRPAGEEVVLGGSRLQGVDLAEAEHADPEEHALLASEPSILVGAHPGEDVHEHRAEHAQPDDHDAEQRIVGQHQSQKRHAGDELDDDADEVSRRDVRDRIEKLAPGGQLAGQAVHEVPHGKPEQSGHEAIGVVDGETHGEQSETAFPQPGEEIEETRGGEEDPDQRPAPGRFLSGEHEVHEQARQDRQGKGRQGKKQSAAQRERERLLHVAQPRQDPGQDAGTDPARPEIGARLEGQRHPRECPVELLFTDPAVAVGRIVDPDPPFAEPFKNDEVVKLPEQDHRQRHAPELFRLPAPSLGLEAVAVRRPDDVGRVAPVPADGACLAQLLDGHPAPEMREHDPEARGPALGLGDLEQHGGAHPVRRNRLPGRLHPLQRLVESGSRGHGLTTTAARLAAACTESWPTFDARRKTELPPVLPASLEPAASIRCFRSR